MTTPRDGDSALPETSGEPGVSESGVPESEAPEIGFDPEAVLERDSRVLLDPVFLATLHEELASEMDAEQAATALMQMGFLHGLQDAIRLLAAPVDARGARRPIFSPPLQMPCRPRADAGRRAGSAAGSDPLHIEGRWPEAREAEARLSSLGSTDQPTCHLSAGYTSGWLTGTFGVDLLAVETSCLAAGADACRFEAWEAAACRDVADVRLQRARADLPFEPFRALVRERVARTTHAKRVPTGDGAGVDREAAAVHIWGPVMVIPWTGADATYHTLEVLARDSGAADVSVIILDLQAAILDEAHDAVALEQLIQTSDAWGTEVLFVDPSPLSDALIADLDPAPLLTLKDLEAAITLAFQIARSQHRTS